MTIDYSRLGKTKEIQKRRYQILALRVKGATVDEIHKILFPTLGLGIKTIENDTAYLRTHQLHDISTAIAKDFNNSAYELKIKELEIMAEKVKGDPKAWTAIQESIRKTRADSLKLQGLMNDKVEHSGTVELNPVVVYLPENKRNDPD